MEIAKTRPRAKITVISYSNTFHLIIIQLYDTIKGYNKLRWDVKIQLHMYMYLHWCDNGKHLISTNSLQNAKIIMLDLSIGHGYEEYY